MYRVLCSNLEYWQSIKLQDQDANSIILNRFTSHERLHFLPETERNAVWVGWVGGGILGVGGAVVIPDCCSSSDQHGPQSDVKPLTCHHAPHLQCPTHPSLLHSLHPHLPHLQVRFKNSIRTQLTQCIVTHFFFNAY